MKKRGIKFNDAVAVAAYYEEKAKKQAEAKAAAEEAARLAKEANPSTEELLKQMISMDEGAAYLGEVALVPYDSPIRNSELTFYNTLFDENACCHLALGMGFANCVKDYGNYTLDECREMGVNDSMIHVDFMIGSEDLSIDAICNDGKTVPVFKNGNWAF